MTNTYDNAAVTVTSEATPDPWMINAHGKYYLMYTAGDRLEIWSASSIGGFTSPQKNVVWRPPPDQPYSDGVWAPELHNLGGRWYIYFAAGSPALGNPSHRMWVLGGPSADQDPTSGEWQFLGGVRGMPDNWAIDGTVFQIDGQYYTVWSGWPEGDSSDKLQYLWIMRLQDPITGSSEPVVISKPEHSWEFSDGDHGVNEGPQFLESSSSNWKGIVYSCAGSWTKDYKLNTLTYRGGDPLSPSSWHKSRHPLIQNNGPPPGPFGPGHCSFVDLNGECVCIFHATDKETDGWENRKARAQRLVFTKDGPYMGERTGPHVNDFNAFMAGPQAGGREQVGGQGQVGQGDASANQSKPHGLKGLLHKLKEEL